MKPRRLLASFLAVITVGLAVYATGVHVLARRVQPKCVPALQKLVQADPRFSKITVASPYGRKAVQVYGWVDSEVTKAALEKLVLDTAGISRPNADGFETVEVYVDVMVEPASSNR